MAHRRAGSTPEYIGGSSEKHYQEQARQRLKAEAWRRWAIRLALLGLLAFAYYMWGDTVRRAVTKQSRDTVQGLENTGKGLKKSTEERTGADFNANE